MNACAPCARAADGLPMRARLALRLVAAAALGVVVGGCVQPVTPEARKLVADARAAYDRGDDPAVVRDTTTFLDRYAQTDLADVAYYLRGLAHYRRKDLSAARADLKLAASRAERRDVRVGALKALGDLAFDAGDLEWAETLYREGLAAAAPRRPPADEIRYRLGCTLQRQGRWAQADEQFDRVVYVFADTEVARRAERRLRCLGWTVQAGAYARQDSARAEAARLRKAGLAAATKSAMLDGKLRFLVHVGRYGRHDEAAGALPAVRRLRSDAFVTPTR